MKTLKNTARGIQKYPVLAQGYVIISPKCNKNVTISNKNVTICNKMSQEIVTRNERNVTNFWAQRDLSI